MQPRNWWLVPWLLVAAAVQVAAFEVVRRVFVDSIRGQLLDTAALTGASIGQHRVDELVDLVLSAMTLVSLTVATVVIGFIALMRRQLVLAVVATVLILGANLTTQLLKYFLVRPEYGIDLARAAAGNSLPSGHTTVAASVAVALVLVLPPRLRAAAALVGTGYAALAGVATLAAGWHRPSDAVAALLVVGAWAAVAGLVLLVASGHQQADQSPRPHRLLRFGLALVGVLLLVVALAALRVTEQAVITQVQLSRTQLFGAYAGGAAGVVSVTCLVMAMVVATVHRVVPQRAGPPQPDPPPTTAVTRLVAPAGRS